MADFSQLCPLFNTGVYSEVTFVNLGFTGVSTTMNAMAGAVAKATQPGAFKFGRTVIVTKVYCQKQIAATTKPIVLAMRHAATGTAAGTAFASLAMTLTVTKNPIGKLAAMTTTAKTFLAADVLGFSNKTKKTAGGRFHFVVRYKER